MSDDEPNNRLDPFPDFNWETLTDARPTEPDAAGLLTTADLVWLLAEGDEVLWNDRSIPLTVGERERAYESRNVEGVRRCARWVEGPRGADYLLSNWWAYPDDAPPATVQTAIDLSRAKGCYPQVHRMSGHDTNRGDILEVLATDALIRRAPAGRVLSETGSLPDESVERDRVEVADRVMHTVPNSDIRHVGNVVGEEFGDLVVEPLDDLAPLAYASYTVTADQIQAIRVNEDAW